MAGPTGRALVVSFVLGAAASVAFARAADAGKPAEPELSWKRQSAFSTLYGEASLQRWEGFGSFEAARTVLAETFRDDAVGATPGSRVEHYRNGATRAVLASGAAARYRLLIEVLLRAEAQCEDLRDRADVLRRGVEYLTEGNGTSLARSLAVLGLSMTRGAMVSYKDAWATLRVALVEAGLAARDEDRELQATLAFATAAGDECSRPEDRYRFAERVGWTVAESAQGEPTFARAMGAVAQTPVSDEYYRGLALTAGFQLWREVAPPPTLAVLTDWLAACSAQMKPVEGRLRVLVRAVERLQSLSPSAPPAATLAQAALELTSPLMGVAPEERVVMLREAATRLRSQPLGPQGAALLDEAGRALERARGPDGLAQVFTEAFSDVLAQLPL